MSNTRNPIPSHAKLVFKGKIFEVWQWEQKMYDGSVAIFERLKRSNTAEVIATLGDKILLQTQEQPNRPCPFTSLPGGGCDEAEDPLSAAKRELLEETGYISNDWMLWKELNPVGKMEWTIYTYIARDCKKVQEPKLDAGEKITTRLIGFEEFLALFEDPAFRSTGLEGTLVRAWLDPKAKEELRALFFGKG
ncbi:MAG: NUDIX domain-containing protein [Nanoarchaeota archaeon]|nr:NUDIX domain-containing protein [Nanoarchaeota archaeon]